NDPSVTFWGTGQALREFLHVDDLAAALLLLMEQYDDVSPINVGSGEEVSIQDLAQGLKDITGYKGDVLFDGDKPDGTPRKLLDSTRLRAMGWAPSIALQDGLQQTWGWYLENGV